MGAKRVALIGHSGAGKSSCLTALGLDRKTADMDAVLGTAHSPSLELALDWLVGTGSTPDIVVVSNHEQMLIAMRTAKVAGLHAEKFSVVCFVYLRKPKDQLQAHLKLPTAGGSIRKEDGQRYTIDTYERFDHMFAQLADETIDCSQRSVADVAATIMELALRIR